MPSPFGHLDCNKGRKLIKAVSISFQGRDMSSPQKTMIGTRTDTDEGSSVQSISGRDAAESMLKTVDKSTQKSTGVSLFHILTISAIGASIALFLSGRKTGGIFVGLWPPTFQALKAVVDKGKAPA